METQLALLTHHQPDGWSPALEKGGYTLGLTPIALLNKKVQGHMPACFLSALYKGGGPLRLRNGGGLAARAAFPFKTICLRQNGLLCRETEAARPTPPSAENGEILVDSFSNIEASENLSYNKL